MEKIKHQRLLDEFAIPDYAQWLQLVEQQLKGVPFERKLVTKTLEGISIQPLYRKADVKAKQQSIPGCYPFKRDARLMGAIDKGWQVAQHYSYPDPKEFNQAVVYDTPRGLNTASFALDQASGYGLDPDDTGAESSLGNGVSIFCGDDLSAAFQGVDLSKLNLLIRPLNSFLPFYCLMIGFLDANKVNRDLLCGSMVSDPLSVLAKTGRLVMPLEKAYDEMAACVTWGTTHTTHFKTLGIDGMPYADAGASASQELAAVIATGVEYLRALQERGVSIDSAAGNAGFHLSLGSDFFLNMAKIRAARTVWAQVVSACGGSDSAQRIPVHAATTRYNKTLYDPHVNLLRATTEAYSAVLAGSDSIVVDSFDQLFRLPNEFSRRISRNIQIILKEESHGHRIIDPGGGSWYLEELTDQLAAKAWETFQEIEKEGGMPQSLLNGTIQTKIAEVSAARRKDLGQRKQVVVGTNMYSNQEEELATEESFDLVGFAESRIAHASGYKSSHPLNSELQTLAKSVTLSDEKFVDSLVMLAEKGATIGQISRALAHQPTATSAVKALPQERLASDYEALRQKAADFKNKNGTPPQVLLVNMGPLKQHKARADFSTGFLQPGGFAVISSDGFDSVEAAVNATIETKAEIAVLCSTDDTYPELVPAFASQVKKARPRITLVVAGYPSDHIDSFRQVGIDDFIHLKANNLQVLQKFQEKAGV